LLRETQFKINLVNVERSHWLVINVVFGNLDATVSDLHAVNVCRGEINEILASTNHIFKKIQTTRNMSKLFLSESNSWRDAKELRKVSVNDQMLLTLSGRPMM
jgi:hypothetical protein